MDHKPELPDEKLRVLLNGGRVAQSRDAQGRRVGPYRVWFKVGPAAGCGCGPEGAAILPRGPAALQDLDYPGRATASHARGSASASVP